MMAKFNPGLKGQAAAEFLMTYGWAVLVVIAAMAALAYFGVLSPDKFLPEKCFMEPGLSCTSHSVKPDTITLVITNGALGKAITVKHVRAGNCEGNFNELMGNGGQATFELSSCNNGAPEEKFKGDIMISYVEKDTNLTKTAYGLLNTKIK